MILPKVFLWGLPMGLTVYWSKRRHHVWRKSAGERRSSASGSGFSVCSLKDQGGASGATAEREGLTVPEWLLPPVSQWPSHVKRDTTTKWGRPGVPPLYGTGGEHKTQKRERLAQGHSARSQMISQMV